jgi:hypothetical protein
MDVLLGRGGEGTGGGLFWVRRRRIRTAEASAERAPHPALHPGFKSGFGAGKYEAGGRATLPAASRGEGDNQRRASIFRYQQWSR